MTGNFADSAAAESRPNDGFIIKPSALQPEALYDRNTAAWFLKITPRSLQRWSEEGDGPRPIRLHPGAPLRYRGADIIKALDRAGRRDGDAGAE